ncbi:MAG: spore germination protein [Oscillospiraceae bacterium]|nr:spore germination protein [Oscillospiraceae bacterium]
MNTEPKPVCPAQIDDAFSGTADLCRRGLRVGGQDGVFYFLDGLTSGSEVAETVIRPLSRLPAASPDELAEAAVCGAVCCAVAERCPDAADAIRRLLNGFAVLCLPQGIALAFEVKTGEKRGPSEPEVESTTRGPKDAFCETSRTNTGLLRRHLRSERLKVWETTAGRESGTNVSLVYVEGLADPTVVTRLQDRLTGLDARDLLTPAAVETAVTGRRGLPLPLLQYTERTDKLAGGLLAGRVGLFVDGLPVGYLAPVDLGLLLRAAEDTDTDPISTGFLRLLRLAALALALLLPGLYVAMATFHQEMLPTQLLEAIIESKRSVPFPTAVEIVGLLLAFELLHEAGLSAPKAVSQPVSIIGGLVVGTAAVEADLISPAALILVSASGICGFALPGKSLVDAIRLCRLGLTVCAALAGLWGLSFGLLALLVYAAGVESFGRPWLSFSELRGEAAKNPCRQGNTVV